jgi:hypothetical protein
MPDEKGSTGDHASALAGEETAAASAADVPAQPHARGGPMTPGGKDIGRDRHAGTTGALDALFTRDGTGSGTGLRAPADAPAAQARADGSLADGSLADGSLAGRAFLAGGPLAGAIPADAAFLADGPQADGPEWHRPRVRAAQPSTAPTMGRAWRALVGTVGEQLDGRPRLWVLEAGAGTRPLFDLPEDTYIVGVDRDGAVLDANRRLDERVVADLADYRPWAAGFDLITCWYVLDGLPDPAPVLDRFAAWTGADGLVVLGVPNLRSPFGVVSRLTGRARLRRTLTAGALCRRFQERGFVPVLQVYFEDARQAARRRRLKITRRRWKAAQVLVRVLSCGLLDAARTHYVVVFRRVEDPAPVH